MTFSLSFGSLLAVRVGDYCVGDGVANDYAGLTQAISDAGTSGSPRIPRRRHPRTS